MVGTIITLQPPLPFFNTKRVVGGNNRSVIKLADQCRIILAAVWINEKSRKPRHHRRHAKFMREGTRHTFHADIIGNVAVEFASRQAKIAILIREFPARVICYKNHPLGPVPLDQFEGSEKRVTCHEKTFHLPRYSSLS